MKLLFDENLSPRLAAAFESDYPDSTHVVSTVEIEAAIRDRQEAIGRLETDTELAVLIV